MRTIDSTYVCQGQGAVVLLEVLIVLEMLHE